MARSFLKLVLLTALLFAAGCDPVARHQFLVTFFNDVPTLPPAEDYCQEAEEQRAKAAAGEASKKEAARTAPPVQSSIHQPYGEKRCNNCHQEEKTTISGLKKSENELCFMCHPKILKHRFVHGPAAEGECLACHLPHEANYQSLLIREPGKLCDKCHSERRLAQGMHDRIKATGVICMDCHDPHSGESRFFLK